MFFQTCVTYFLLWNTKEDILKKKKKKKKIVYKMKVSGVQNKQY